MYWLRKQHFGNKIWSFRKGFIQHSGFITRLIFPLHFSISFPRCWIYSQADLFSLLCVPKMAARNSRGYMPHLTEISSHDFWTWVLVTLIVLTCVIYPSLSHPLQPGRWNILTGLKNSGPFPRDGMGSISPKLCGGKFQSTGKKNKRGLHARTGGDRVQTGS